MFELSQTLMQIYLHTCLRIYTTCYTIQYILALVSFYELPLDLLLSNLKTRTWVQAINLGK